MPIGITFKETMAGPLALGETDPEQGAEKGEHMDTSLTMNATVTIDDLDAFISDPAHLASLAGAIDFPPLGERSEASSGLFNLFSPADDPKLKYMVYELALQCDGGPRYLAGKKYVRDDPGFDLWSDTTTLYTTLHEGGNASGSLIGAGILRLDIGDFLRLISTITVTGTDSKMEQAAAVAKFGKFFMGELWDTYSPEF